MLPMQKDKLSTKYMPSFSPSKIFKDIREVADCLKDAMAIPIKLDIAETL